MKSVPIFIVGVQRSGTTLLSAMLAAHSRLSCGPETHFFERLSLANIQCVTDTERWPNCAFEFIKSITFTNYTNPGAERISIFEKYNLIEDQVFDYLSTQQPGIAPILNAIITPYMKSLGKSRWVEKTPDHIKHLDLIREHFPFSPIIRIMRDPRDVALSLMKVPWGTKTFFEAIEYWKYLDDLSYKFFENDELSYTLRFEDLVIEPESELKKLCQFICEDFEYSMLNTSTTGKQVNSQSVPWKKKVEQPIDKNRAYNWKSQLESGMNGYAEAVIGDRLLHYGYPVEEIFPIFGEIYPPTSHLHLFETKIMGLASEGVRFWKKEINEYSKATIFLGEPMNPIIDNNSIILRIRNFVVILIKVILAKIKNKKLYWVKTENQSKSKGIGNRFLTFVLKKYLY